MKLNDFLKGKKTVAKISAGVQNLPTDTLKSSNDVYGTVAKISAGVQNLPTDTLKSSNDVYGTVAKISASVQNLPTDALKSSNDIHGTLAIVCNQWGDTGKGKLVDYFAEWADIIARGTGGANAGHTIMLNNTKYIFHLVPSGILYDSLGKINVIGQGVAFDPRALIEELNVLEKEGKTYNNLKISLNAKLVLPYHILFDRLKEAVSSNKIGTTGRGIGPVYVDHYDRKGMIVNDMLNKSIFAKKLKKNLDLKTRLLKSYDKEVVKKILMHPHLENGAFYNEETLLDYDNILKYYTEKYAQKLKSYICDVEQFMRDSIGKKNILLEGAQGYLLSVDHGSYPYVTSSDPTIFGLTKGVGLSTKDVDLNLGIVKAFYMTRVGKGPFPTEFGGSLSDKHCSSNTKESEQEKYPNASLDSEDEMEFGVAVRFAGGEYGATTKRPRRTGWLDLALLRRAVITNGPNIILTKVDVLSNAKKIKLCTEYEYVGEDFYYGNKLIKSGDKIHTAILDSSILEKCKPIYKEFPGWQSDIRNIRKYVDLPEKLKNIIKFIEKECNVNVRIVSVGPERNETIIKG